MSPYARQEVKSPEMTNMQPMGLLALVNGLRSKTSVASRRLKMLLLPSGTAKFVSLRQVVQSMAKLEVGLWAVRRQSSYVVRKAKLITDTCQTPIWDRS